MRHLLIVVAALLTLGCAVQPVCPLTEEWSRPSVACVEWVDCGPCAECARWEDGSKQWPFVLEACMEGEPVEPPR